MLRAEKGVAAQVLASLGVTIERTLADVAAMVGEGTTEPSRKIPFTRSAKKVLELSLREALALRHDDIGTEHLLLGLVADQDGAAIQSAGKGRTRSSGDHPRNSSSLGSVTRARALGVSTRLEYRIERWEHAENKHRLEELNELGTKGWQLADITPVPDGAQWIFQRPVTPRWKYKATTLR